VFLGKIANRLFFAKNGIFGQKKAPNCYFGACDVCRLGVGFVGFAAKK